MQFQSTGRGAAAQREAKEAAGEHATRHTLLSMYATPPAEDISMDEFERLALERLRGACVLRHYQNFRLDVAMHRAACAVAFQVPPRAMFDWELACMAHLSPCAWHAYKAALQPC